MNREFKIILKEFLIENNFNQTEFARQINVKPSQISEWLKGKAKPGYDNLRQIVIAFNLPTEYLLGLPTNTKFYKFIRAWAKNFSPTPLIFN